MDTPAPISSSLDRTFRITVTLKGLDGALEVIGGLVLLFVRPAISRPRAIMEGLAS
jgi:uncharacterized membrane protein